MTWALLCVVAAAQQLEDTQHHTGPVSVGLCPDSPYSRAQVRRALHWWQKRCVVPTGIGRIHRHSCEPNDPIEPNTIYISGSPDHLPPDAAAGTLTEQIPGGPVHLIEVRPEHVWRTPLRFSYADRIIMHEFGHALAFDHPVDHHSGPGSVMAPSLDTMGPSDASVDLCP